jgi:hypothetical protein
MRTTLKFFSLAILTLTGHAALSQSAKPPFSITISSPKDSVPHGGEVTVKITLTNISDHEINLERAPREDQGQSHHAVIIRDDHGDLVPQKKPVRVGKDEAEREINALPHGSQILFTLKPGESLKDGIVLDGMYDLSQPGKHTIQIERYDYVTKAVVKSNTITFTLTP